MTVSTAPTPLSYAGNGSTTAFPITWKYNSTTHVVATLRSSTGTETVWVVTTNYTITAAGDTGTLTAVTAPATGETLVITLEPPNTQSSDFPLGGDFPSTTVEDGLDLSAQRDAKIEALFLRALRVPKTDSRTGSSLELPIDTLRASKFLGFDADGDPIAAAGTSANLTPVSTFIDTLLDDTTAAVARTTLGAVGLTGDETIDGIKAFTGANTHTGVETHSGAETHSGIETHSAAEVFSGTPSINLTGGQIKFPATQIASADANTLDDYEEGTFTPTLLFGGAATGIVYSVQLGSYTKIGNLVSVNVRVATTTKSSSTGAATVGGLPFTIGGVTAAFAIRCGSTVTFSGQLQAYGDTSASVINLQQITEAGTSGNLTDANFSNISSITLGGSYSV